MDSFTPPTCPSAMPEKMSLHSWHLKDKRERENKTKSSRKQQNQNLHQPNKKRSQIKTKPTPTGSSIHLQREEMVSELFRNLSPLTCNTAAVR